MVALPMYRRYGKQLPNCLQPRAVEPTPATAEPITLPIRTGQVKTIASAGFPLWESVEALQLRNRRITLAYSDLSTRLAKMLEPGERDPNANFCTFATWASKTLGATIETRPAPGLLEGVGDLPGWLRSAVRRFAQLFTTRSHGSMYRSLAAGNRFVFLEGGWVLAQFIECFEKIPPGAASDERWDAFWPQVEQVMNDLRSLDASWLAVEQIALDDLQRALRCYLDARAATSGKEKAELILAGNILIAAFEQRRVDGYVRASMALFANRAMRHLVTRESGAVKSWFRRFPTEIYGWLLTRLLVIETADERLRVGRLMPARDDDELFPKELREIDLPLLQALLTRYDLSLKPERRGRAWSWTRYDDRMTFIVNFFRSRQRTEEMFHKPFPADVETALLAGRLETSATTFIEPCDAEPPQATAA